MRDYKVIIHTMGLEGPDDFELAKTRIMADLDCVEFRGFEFRVVDIQQLPARAGSNVVKDVTFDLARASAEEDKYQSEDYDAQFPPGPSALLPPAGVTHPWDQGAWIFPDDHPLAPVERAAKLDGSSQVKHELMALVADEEFGVQEGEVVDE